MKAVVIFNLGGPDSLENVKPFLFNLFYDRAILNLPNPLRYLLAKILSSRRNKTAQEIYKHLGGKSPIAKETEMQLMALQNKLGAEYKVFMAMRYWYPMVDEVLEQVIASKPNEIILLPLYPQFSKTTTGSFFEQWESRMRHKGCKILVRKICCYPELPLYINASQDVIQNSIKQNQIPENARYLFSAHGLPKKNIQKGDPYEIHVHMSVDSIVKGLPQIKDHVICYQSKVGPLEWLGPSTEDEIKRACEDQVPMVIVPISFVSENSETLYELDYQYKLYADNLGIKEYYRVPTVRDNSYYISALASMIQTCYQQKCSAKSCDQPCGQYLAA